MCVGVRSPSLHNLVCLQRELEYTHELCESRDLRTKVSCEEMDKEIYLSCGLKTLGWMAAQYVVWLKSWCSPAGIVILVIR